MRQVYFMRRVDGTGPIKIGCSDYPKSRAAQLSSDYGCAIEVLATVPGDFIDERNLHLKLARYRCAPPFGRQSERKTPVGGHSEWFEPSPAVLAVLGEAVATKRVPLTKAERREKLFAERYLAGETLQQIADDYGITRERVRQILRRAGVPSLGMREEHKRHFELTAADETAIEMLRAGARPKDIVQTAGIRKHRVGVLRRHIGLEAAPRGTWLKRPDGDELTARICELYRAGVPTSEIAAATGLSAQPCVYRYLARAGVKPGRKERLTIDAVEATRLFNDGATLKEIADRLNCYPRNVRDALVDHGVAVSNEELERRRVERVRAANTRRRAA